MITQEQLKALLHYDPETGVFTWLVSRVGASAGNIAGCISNGYIKIMLNREPYLAHRLAWLYMTGSFPINQIDHRNNIKNDNRFCNLRAATRSENIINQGIKSSNTSGFKGVSFHKRTKKWVSHIKINRKGITIGYFSTAELASIAYNERAKRLHGEFRHPSIL